MTADPQWVPTEADVRDAVITDFAAFVARRHGVTVDDYRSLWRWSVAEPADFWQDVWDYFEFRSATDPGPALADATMPGAVWFPGATVNYVDHVFRNARPGTAAIRYAGEGVPDVAVGWDELRSRVASLAATLRDHGVGVGDRVVGYLPNIPEAVVAFLATASLGAVWAACGQDYSAPAALDRLGQLEPKALITADGYRFAGKTHDRLGAAAQLRGGMPSLVLTVVVSHLDPDATVDGAIAWADAVGRDDDLEPVAVPFDHPLWVVFSSGTTGLPKGIVHGHGGVLLEHVKSLALQLDIGREDVLFWYTSPSWMMWNFQTAGLLVGATIVCYDGSPSYPTPDALWALVSRLGVTVVGTSPGYVLACDKAGVVPVRDHDLSALRAVGVTGSTLPASSSLWLSENVGRRVPVVSITGGTDVVSAFVGGARTVPVWPGELSAPCLGVAVDAFDESGRPVRSEVGELVVTAPMPSMPVSFWNDPEGKRYREAYFEVFPGVWRHGDWITITDRGTVLMHGRSDSTLNRNGIRMGSADIYQVVEKLPEIAEALVVGVDLPDGGYWMPLFVVLADGVTLDDALKQRIRGAIREQASPRHVPDDIIEAPGIPHTRTGKKLEVPLKRIFQGADAGRTVDRSAVDDPGLIDWFASHGR
ncbi:MULTISPECIES: acetoacetate--CoA ligase [unclassified Rhodococcus (in: high G+C Gram-positive bacteria)]|uniref:acetoacetate--CoA ligase n=1 Tax=unclassified Rhodococcus (in: high G+C Gram-positive bacteria) TaxID=192944 RepID=UPI00163B5A28|nr:MULTISPECIES: acetoacetate--CoA ligase [unclassified Rhodococcus (in: high G+C Gram-positive bacteria)]MBC2643321.1 acetoacetate--CoA ligase [Rhodococcus sp. 3A]MBC2891938.1 acetoacetate--CoA ligase [Rhodococcus sp. 4CII]